MPITDRYGSRGSGYVVVFLLTRLLVPSERPTVCLGTASPANWHVCDMISRAFVGHGRCRLKAERLASHRGAEHRSVLFDP